MYEGSYRSILPILINFDGLHLDRLLKSLLDIVIDTAWSLQLQASDTVCVSDFLARPYAPLIDEYMKHARDLLQDIESHLATLKTELNGLLNDDDESENNENMNPVSDVKSLHTNNLDVLRQSMLVKMISDADSITALNTNSNNNVSLTANSWFNSPESSFSSAVNRRKEDYYLGFAISVMINTINDEEKFNTTVIQLGQIINGTGSRPQRRVTTRSKYRASQALHLLDTNENAISGKYYNNMNLQQVRSDHSLTITHLLTYLLTHSPTHLHTHSLTHYYSSLLTITHSLTHTYSLPPSLPPSLTHSRVYYS